MKYAVEDDPPRYIKGIDFGVLSPPDIIKGAEVEIASRELYDLSQGRMAKQNGAIDRRMGVSNNFTECDTCHGKLATCHGHFGHIKLALPVFHVGYFKQIISILQCICKECSRILLTEENRRKYLNELRRPDLDNLRRMNILKKIIEQCKKQRKCLNCGCMNGVVKKAGSLKIVHDKFRYISKKGDDEKDAFDESFKDATAANPDLEKFLKRAMDDLNPLKVLNLFREILPSDCQLLGMDPERGRPEMYIWRYVPAPPVCIRPSVQQDTATNEDDLTVKLTEVVFASCQIRAGIEKGMALNNLMELWDYMQLTLALYINADTPSGPGMPAAKPIRGLCQRLKGKQGRFRGNLSGKRVDFSGRTVISPDPNLRVDEVAVPDRVAKILTYPEKVTRYNKEKLQTLVMNGATKYPGANYVIKGDRSMNLKFAKKNDIANNLQVGDIVERHLEDGDVVLFNRQPSLHRLSILSHYVKVRPWRTFRLNECVCTPYNADFDGDEMNLHVPQTEEARTEAISLMGVKHNLVTPQSGEPIIAATQDFITGSYLISKKDSFFDRGAFCELLASMCDANLQFDIPPPAIWKPRQLWTGKQIFSLLIKPNKESPIVINLEAKNKTFHPPAKGAPLEMSPNDGYLVVRGSEVISGVMDKSTLGDGKKHSVFFTILRDYGPKYAAIAMNRMAKMCARFLGNQGFSIGIGDVTPGAALRSQKDDLVEQAYDKCNALIELLRQGKLETQPGCNEEQTLESKISGILSKVREELGDVCLKELEKSNAPLIMGLCGSKGSLINISQMVSAVGQQIISGSRVPDGFQDRSLPHFPKFSKSPPAKGFVRNSFFSGLTPPEFLFHAISGREGLVDTAVKTADTGYASRRLMKSLEDLSSQYDNTVRTSANGIVQFNYGGDGLDPFDMEGDAVPVNFIKTWHHSMNITFKHEDYGLKPYEIIELAESIIKPLEDKLQRKDNLGKIVKVEDEQLDIYADERDPQRGFYQSIREFIKERAELLGQVRVRKNMVALTERPVGEEYLDDVDYDELVPVYKKLAVDQVYKISSTLVKEFLRQCLKKYERSKVEPGTAVGAIGAQSIGEPGTQMTLKTFHFAGVASMNVTLGVPRIKEIINASKVISTPIITAVLQNDEDERVARMIKGRIEKTQLSHVVKYIEDVFMEHNAYIGMKVDWKTIERLRLELSIDEVAAAIVKAPKLKITTGDVRIVGEDTIHVAVLPQSPGTGKNATALENEVYYRSQLLRRQLPNITVKGFPDIARAVINIKEKDNKKELLVEGYGLKDVMTTDGVVGHETSTNHVLENYSVLGIEAARASIINEIDTTMSSHGMSVDPRHIQLLGDVMTFKGEVLGITRFGLAKMRDSVLQLASFEKTTDHLFDAAFYMKSDSIDGVSECIILGQSMGIGTGAFKVVRPVPKNDDSALSTKATFFEDLIDELGENEPAEFDENELAQHMEQ